MSDSFDAWIECIECQWPNLCELDGECVIVWDAIENADTYIDALLELPGPSS